MPSSARRRPSRLVHGRGVGCPADLLGLGQLAQAVERAGHVEIAAGLHQEIVDDEVEMQHRDQRHQIGHGLVKGQEIAGAHRPDRHADLGEQDRMAELVRQDVEAQAVGHHDAAARGRVAGLDEAVAGLGIVPRGQRDHLEPRQQVGELPAQLVAEIVLPDVEHPADHPEHVRGAELPAVIRQRVEMAATVGTGRRADWPDERRQVGIAVEPFLAGPGRRHTCGDRTVRRQWCRAAPPHAPAPAPETP